jgi:hypothetical protein
LVPPNLLSIAACSPLFLYMVIFADIEWGRLVPDYFRNAHCLHIRPFRILIQCDVAATHLNRPYLLTTGGAAL